MKRIFLLILLCFLLPAHAYSSPLKDKWKADFKKLEKEKNEKLAPLLQKITENRIFNLMFTTENSIPQLRILVEALSDCILIRKGFIEQASKIGDNSFQSNKFNIMNAEKTALDTDSYNRDVYKIRLDDLEFPFLIETSYAMAQQAISLYETAISNSDTLPDRFGADIQNAYKLIEEAYNRLNRAKIIAKKKNAPYNSPEEWRAFIQNIDNIADYKNDLSSILEQINQLPAKLRETLDGLVKITDSIDLSICP